MAVFQVERRSGKERRCGRERRQRSNPRFRRLREETSGLERKSGGRGWRIIDLRSGEERRSGQDRRRGGDWHNSLS